jgi:hypothetical protein
MKKIALSLRSLCVLAAMLAITSIVACIALIPVAIHYYETDQNYVATADVPLPAKQVYSKAVSLAEEKAASGQLKIVKKDDADLLIEVTDGKQNASLKAISAGSDKSKMIVTASLPKEKEKRKKMEEELALRIVKNMCTQLDTKCTVVKNKK